MLKLLYKTILISTMSFSLMVFDSVAFAQATQNGGLRRSADGVLTKTETINFKPVTDGDMLSSITMLAVGMISGRMAVSYRPITVDVMIAAAGGVAFIAGEVLSNMSFKKTMDEMSIEITKSSDGKVDQEQIQRLQDLKVSYQEAKSTTHTKKMLQMGAAAAFAGAAAYATYLATQEDVMDAACTSAMSMAQNSLSTCAMSISLPPNEVKDCGSCLVELAHYMEDYGLNDIQTKIPAKSLVKEARTKKSEIFLEKGTCVSATGFTTRTIATGVNSSCKRALTFKFGNEVSGSAIVPVNGASNNEYLLNKILFGHQRAIATYEVNQSEKNNYMFDNFASIFFPKAQASWIPLLGLGAGAAASLLLIRGTLGEAIDIQMFVPLNRAIAFGVLAGLSFMASQSSQNQMDKIDQNIAKIDQILNDMNALQKGIKSNNVREQQIKLASFQATQAQDLQYNSNASVKSDCAASAGSTNCKTLGGQLASMPGFGELPDSFKSIASQSATMADGLSGTNIVSGSTLTAASSLAGKQNAINNLLTKTQEKLNDQLVKQGKPKIDFAKEQKNLLAKWNGATDKALKSSGISPGEFLASAGRTPFSAPLNPVASKKSFVPATGDSAAPPSSKGFELDLKEPQAGTDSGSYSNNEKAPKWDIGSNDINTNNKTSIFQVISNRYIKSGYPKLFEEIPEKK